MVDLYLYMNGWFCWFSCRQICRSSHGSCGLIRKYPVVCVSFFRGSPLTTATTSTTTTTTTTTTPPPPTPPTPPPLTARFLHGTFQFDHSCDVIHSDRRNKAFSGTLRSLNGTNFGTTRWVLHGVKEGAPINGQNTVTGVKFHTLLIEVISRQFWYGPTLQK